MSQDCVTVRAKWILAVDRPPIENGCISVRAGRIIRVDKASKSETDVDLGDAILFPQFVNAHTHLEFSRCTAPFGSPGSTFASWIKQVIESRRGLSAPEFVEQKRLSIHAGLVESRSAAVAAIGEISSLPWSGEDYQVTSPSSVVYHERLGLSQDSIARTMADLNTLLAAERSGPSRAKMGISPHAPYSTHIDLVRGLVEIANRYRLPVAMHLAESREELELLKTRRGPLRQLLDDLGVWHDNAIPTGVGMLDFLKLLATNERSLVVHGNYLSGEEMDFIGLNRQRMHVAFCPRTHEFFGHARYPLSGFLQRGISVSLATDSRASNPDLRLANEIALAAKRFPEIEPKRFLAMATLNPARAIGVDSDYGSIAPGKLTQFAVIDLPIGANGNPESLWLEGISQCRPLNLPAFLSSGSV